MSIVKNVEIQLIDDDAKSTTIKLDNPKTNITKNEIITVFATAISNNWLLSNYGNPIKGIGQVQLTTSEKILLEGEPVYVTPASATLRPKSDTPATQNFAVANGTIQMVELSLNADSSGNFMNASETHTANSITVTITMDGTPMGTIINNYTLKVLIGNTIVSIPIIATTASE